MSVKETIAKAPERRTRRSPLLNRGKLSVANKDPNFAYRFVNDEGDRVQELIERGYEVVTKSETKIGDARVESATSEGSIQQVLSGDGKRIILMKQPKEFYEEDQAIKQSIVDQREQATKQEALNGHYGKLEITRK
jgi:hypothetical protein